MEWAREGFEAKLEHIGHGVQLKAMKPGVCLVSRSTYVTMICKRDAVRLGSMSRDGRIAE